MKFLRFGLGNGNLELVGYGIRHGCSWVNFQACHDDRSCCAFELLIYYSCMPPPEHDNPDAWREFTNLVANAEGILKDVAQQHNLTWAQPIGIVENIQGR